MCLEMQVLSIVFHFTRAGVALDAYHAYHGNDINQPSRDASNRKILSSTKSKETQQQISRAVARARA